MILDMGHAHCLFEDRCDSYSSKHDSDACLFASSKGGCAHEVGFIKKQQADKEDKDAENENNK